jgi:hypothetical protein
MLKKARLDKELTTYAPRPAKVKKKKVVAKKKVVVKKKSKKP